MTTGDSLALVTTIPCFASQIDPIALLDLQG